MDLVLLYDVFLSLLVAVSLSLLTTFFLGITLPFLRTTNSYFMCVMLPSVVLILTQAVSSNLYLSLGLIGALSIVRFRSPVKSQLELGYLFILIGIGVATGVSITYAFALATLVITIVPVHWVLSKFFPNIVSFEKRFNSNGRIEMTVDYNINDLKKINMTPKQGRIIRIDNFENKIEIFYSFLSLESALKYVSENDKVIKSYSILNN